MGARVEKRTVPPTFMCAWIHKSGTDGLWYSGKHKVSAPSQADRTVDFRDFAHLSFRNLSTTCTRAPQSDAAPQPHRHAKSLRLRGSLKGGDECLRNRWKSRLLGAVQNPNGTDAPHASSPGALGRSSAQNTSSRPASPTRVRPASVQRLNGCSTPSTRRSSTNCSVFMSNTEK